MEPVVGYSVGVLVSTLSVGGGTSVAIRFHNAQHPGSVLLAVDSGNAARVALGQPRILASGSSKLRLILAMIRLVRSVRCMGIAVILAEGPIAGLLAACAKLFVHFRLVSRVGRLREPGLVGTWLWRFVHSVSDKVVGPTQTAINSYPYLRGRSSVQHVWNPMDLQRIDREANTVSQDEDSVPYLAVLGRLIPEKRVDMAIRLFGKLMQAGYSGNLKIGGSGRVAEIARLRRVVAELGLCNRVQFLGTVSSPIRFLRDADGLLFFGMYEGFGYVVAEALAVGTPVLTQRCHSGHVELLDTFGIGYCYIDEDLTPSDLLHFLRTTSPALKPYPDDLTLATQVFQF